MEIIIETLNLDVNDFDLCSYDSCSCDNDCRDYHDYDS